MAQPALVATGRESGANFMSLCGPTRSDFCRALDNGKSDGQSYIAMEFLDELTLKHCMAGRPLEIATLRQMDISGVLAHVEFTIQPL